MITIRNADFRITHQSRNLRGILDHTRRAAVERIDIWPGKDGTAQLGVAWADGSTCITTFASAEVCKRWCAARRAFPAAVIH